MKTVGNLLWLVLCGVWIALGWLFWAVVLAMTVLGLALQPFGKKIVRTGSSAKPSTWGPGWLR